MLLEKPTRKNLSISRTKQIRRPLFLSVCTCACACARAVQNFFDSGSFIESLAHWGRTVVTGRARLGGLPIGVVAVETRMVEKTLPPDPAFEDSQQQIIQQAGQVHTHTKLHKSCLFSSSSEIGVMCAENCVE